MSKLDFINQKSLDPDLAVLDSLCPSWSTRRDLIFLERWSRNQGQVTNTKAWGPARAGWVWDLAHLPFSLWRFLRMVLCKNVYGKVIGVRKKCLEKWHEGYIWVTNKLSPTNIKNKNKEMDASCRQWSPGELCVLAGRSRAWEKCDIFLLGTGVELVAPQSVRDLNYCPPVLWWLLPPWNDHRASVPQLSCRWYIGTLP